jgi:hypothetical protein
VGSPNAEEVAIVGIQAREGRELALAAGGVRGAGSRLRDANHRNPVMTTRLTVRDSRASIPDKGADTR